MPGRNRYGWSGIPDQGRVFSEWCEERPASHRGCAVYGASYASGFSRFPDLDGAYAAFGKIIEGMDIVDKIATVQTDFRDRPLQEQKMKKVTVDTQGTEYPEPEKA